MHQLARAKQLPSSFLSWPTSRYTHMLCGLSSDTAQFVRQCTSVGDTRGSLCTPPQCLCLVVVAPLCVYAVIRSRRSTVIRCEFDLNCGRCLQHKQEGLRLCWVGCVGGSGVQALSTSGTCCLSGGVNISGVIHSCNTLLCAVKAVCGMESLLSSLVHFVFVFLPPLLRARSESASED